MNRNLAAFGTGVSIIAAVSAVAMTLLYFDISSDAGLMMWGSLVLAGFTTAAMAASHKVAFAVLLTVPAALLFSLENALWQLAGKPADHYGLEGGIIVILMSIPFGAVLSSVGGTIGWFITRNTTRNKRVQPTCEDARG